jgi:hypothetical protein
MHRSGRSIGACGGACRDRLEGCVSDASMLEDGQVVKSGVWDGERRSSTCCRDIFEEVGHARVIDEGIGDHVECWRQTAMRLQRKNSSLRVFYNLRGACDSNLS